MTEQRTSEPSDPRQREDWKELSRELQTILLLGAILDKLEDVRCCVIDVESATENVAECVKYG